MPGPPPCLTRTTKSKSLSETIPSSTRWHASHNATRNSRSLTKPGALFTTIGDFPKKQKNSRNDSRVLSEVRLPRDSSTNREAFTGFGKWAPANREGFEMEPDTEPREKMAELVQKIVEGEQTLSSSRKAFAFFCRFSGSTSKTRSARAAAL